MYRLALAAALVALIALTTAIPLGHPARRALIPRQRWRYWVHRAGLVLSPTCAVEGVPFGAARMRHRRLVRTAHHTQESPMDHIPGAIAVASLRTHRLILTVDNDGAAATHSNLSYPATAAVLRHIARTIAPQANDRQICLEGLFTGTRCPGHAKADAEAPASSPITPQEGIDEARKAIEYVLQTFLDRVPRAELEADIMADALADALSDELSDLYTNTVRLELVLGEQERQAARADEAEAKLARARAVVLRDAADALDNSKTLRDLTDDHMHDVHAAANELRRMAEEAR
ncbi:hypothetical protein ACFU8I_38425 [Streptomyces sp. NPDC057540]|uniref:hypothetical protein n=1 Tax=Streptomyces sp. NPDC057540 TaxID=3346160 RepID=UPI00369E9ACE